MALKQRVKWDGGTTSFPLAPWCVYRVMSHLVKSSNTRCEVKEEEEGVEEEEEEEEEEDVEEEDVEEEEAECELLIVAADTEVR